MTNHTVQNQKVETIEIRTESTIMIHRVNENFFWNVRNRYFQTEVVTVQVYAHELFMTHISKINAL